MKHQKQGFFNKSVFEIEKVKMLKILKHYKRKFFNKSIFEIEKVKINKSVINSL